MRTKRLFRLNESRDRDIRKLASIALDEHTWNDVEESNLDEFFTNKNPYRYGALVCMVVNQYIWNEFLKEPFFRKNADIEVYDYDTDADWFDGITIKIHNYSEEYGLFNAIGVNPDSIDVAITTRINDKEETEKLVVNFMVKYNKTSTVSDVIESILDYLDKYMSKIISHVKDEILFTR